MSVLVLLLVVEEYHKRRPHIARRVDIAADFHGNRRLGADFVRFGFGATAIFPVITEMERQRQDLQ